MHVINLTDARIERASPSEITVESDVWGRSADIVQLDVSRVRGKSLGAGRKKPLPIGAMLILLGYAQDVALQLWECYSDEERAHARRHPLVYLERVRLLLEANKNDLLDTLIAPPLIERFLQELDLPSIAPLDAGLSLR